MFTQSNTPALESREAGGLIKATELKGIQGIDMYITLFGDDYLAGVELLERQLRKMSRQDGERYGYPMIQATLPLTLSVSR